MALDLAFVVVPTRCRTRMSIELGQCRDSDEDIYT